MNKETFLEELRGYLRVLEDQEQEDILAEYAQHIDIKIQKGLTEEEAIRDFGPMKELASGILEAYHVKPEFDNKKPVVGMPHLKGVKIVDAGNYFRKTGSFLKAKMAGLIQGISRGFRWLGRKCRGLAVWAAKPFSRRKGIGEKVEYERQEVEDTQGTAGTEMGRTKRIFAAFIRGTKRLWGWLTAVCIWWLRLFWNLTWLFMTLFFGFFAMTMLAGLGAGAVLLPQGYPLMGTLVICLGGMLCFGALSCGSYSLVIRRKKEIQGAAAETADIVNQEEAEEQRDTAELE